jgi:DNA-binding CsgD family transcriptional regulator/tetratricopeptide (TPR) repeat protein
MVTIPELTGAGVFVGREGELAALLESFELVAKAHTAFAMVSGEAGIGKSRLANELCRRVAERAQGVAIGHCLETIRTPFFPFLEIFDELGLNAGFEAAQNKDSAVRGRAQRERHLRRLQSLAHSLLTAAINKPFVVVIEDVHWADAATLGLLEHLAVSRAHGQLMVVLTVRAEEIERGGAFARVLVRLRNAGLITVGLGPLAPREVTELLRSSAPKPLARETIARIRDLAEGNPLFVEELLRAAVDDDNSLLDPAYANIRATVIDRFYLLCETDQRVLVCAAVAGRFFDVPLVAELSKRSFDEVLATLARARSLQLVRDGPSPQTIAFRHAVFCEVIYRELLRADAQSLHAKVAEYAERQPERPLAEIAYHWSKAGNHDKAREYNLRAGDDAMQLTAFEDAARCYDEAIRYISPGTFAYAELAEKRAYAWYSAGVGENTGRMFADAVAGYEAIGQRQKVVEMHLFLSRQAWNDAETPDGYRHAMRAAELIGDADPSLRDYAKTMAASYATHLGDVDEAAQILDFAIGGNPEIAARMLDTQAIIQARRGDVDAALALCAEAQEVARQSGGPDVRVRVVTNAADVYAACGRLSEAADLWRDAYVVAQASGYIGRMAYAALGYAAALLLCGDIARARELYGIAVGTGVSNACVAIQAAAVGAMLRALVDSLPPVFPEGRAILDMALHSKESLRIGQLGGAIAFEQIASNRNEEARETLARSVAELTSPAFAEMLLLLAAAHGDPETQAQARSLLATSPSHSGLAVADLCKKGAQAAQLPARERNVALGELANAAAQLSHYPLQLAFLRLSGDDAKACRVAETIGATGYAKRLEKLRERPSPSRLALTRRELEVARLLAEQESNRGIALRLGLSERTVEHHVASILSRLDVRSRWLVTPELISSIT